MKRVLLSVLVTLIVLSTLTQFVFSNESINSNNLTNIQVTKSLASMPLSFTENQGQWDDRVKFRANAGGAIMWFSSDGAYYQFTRTIATDPISIVDKRYGMPDDMMDRQPDSVETMMIKANFIGSNRNPIIHGADEIDYKCNYFIGNDESQWATDVPNYKAVVYEEVYDGIDLKYYGNDKQMEYDFIVSPGTDYSQITIQYEGAEAIAINDNGELVVTTKWGKVVEHRPVIYQVENNNRIPIDGKYILQANNSFSFELSDYNQSLPLVIDPLLSYSTYLGGTVQDNCYGFTVNDAGNAFITGWVRSTDFPTTAGVYQDSLADVGNFDTFVTKLNQDGSALIFSTYIGGDKTDQGYGIKVDSVGDVYLAGDTWATDFPTTVGAYQTTVNGTNNYDAFILKLNSSGSSLVFSTLLGGTKDEDCYDISIDDSGYSYICGTTESSNFPTTAGVIQETFIGTFNDAFVAKLNPTATALVYSTYLGGNNVETAWAIDSDNLGNAYITGYTASTNFPTTSGSVQPTINGTASEAYVTKLNPLGAALVYGSYLGGVGSEVAYGITVDTSGNAYVAGFTNGSADFPITVGPHKPTLDGSIDAFVTKFNPTGDTLVFSTYLGGSNSDYIRSIGLDKFDNVYIAGTTASSNFPTTEGAYQTVIMGGPYDGFMAKLNYLGTALEYSTYMGGASASESMYGLALDSSDNVFFAGNTSSPSFPTTTGAYQESYQGTSGDAFIVKFSDFSTDISEYDIGNLPSDFIMSQNYPNPFNPTTTIEFNLPTKSNVTVTIYNLLGQKIKQLVNQEYSVGNYKVTWDGTTSNGSKTSTGMYFYRIETDDFVETKKMLLLK